jgi:hypothetical protein
MKKLSLILVGVLLVGLTAHIQRWDASLDAMERDLTALENELVQVAAISIRVTVDGVNTDTPAFTARQVALMNRRLADFNAQRTANGQATVTMGVYLRGFIVQHLRDYEEIPAEANEQAEACAALMALTPAARATELARPVWNGKSPCR